MTTPKTRPDGFDILLADYRNSTHLFEDDRARVLRHWHELPAEGKLDYVASAAAMSGVPFDRFAAAAREVVGGQPLPAGVDAYLRLHVQYQRALWDSEQFAFPREDPLPENDPHRDTLDAIYGVLDSKFYRLLDDYTRTECPFPDADGAARPWGELSAEGKVRHVARAAAIFGVPFKDFADAAREAVGTQPLPADEQACLRLQFQYARQLRDPAPLPLPLAPNAGKGPAGQEDGLRDTLRDESAAGPAPGKGSGTLRDMLATTSRSRDAWLAGSIDPMLTELEAFGDEFQRLARTPEQREMAGHFQDWIANTGRTVFADIRSALREHLQCSPTPPPQRPKEPDRSR